MPGPRPARTAEHRIPRWVTGAIVAVLAVIVIVLAVLAIVRTRAEPTMGTPLPLPASTSTVTPSATPTPSISPSASPTQTPAAAAPGAAERFLAVGTSTLWRATAGSCGGAAPVLERSDDSGGTWVDVTPHYLGVAQILMLDPFAGDEAEIVARVGANCEVQALRTFTQGNFWQSYPEVLAASTYIDPSNAASIVTPGGAVPAPCATAWGLRSSNGVIGVICDGTAQQYANGSWTPVATDAVAVAVSGGTVIAAHAAAGCSGLSIGSACTGQQSPSAPAAIAVGGGATYQWVGDAVLTVPGA